jgi:uroporphyrinogen decarboxylase
MASGPTPIESFLLMIYSEPEVVELLLDFYTSYSIAVINAIADLPFDFFYIGDDVTGFVSPEHLERLWATRHEKIVRLALDTGKPVLCHCCGSQKEVLPYFDRWGVHAVHPLQPDMNDIYAVREQYPRLALVGNIGVQEPLSFGTPEDVVADTLDHLERLGPLGGYVMASSHSIIDSIPPENYHAMVETTWQYGN